MAGIPVDRGSRIPPPTSLNETCSGGNGGSGMPEVRTDPAVAPPSTPPVPVPPARHRDRDLNDDWPLRSYLELGALPSAVPCARCLECL